MNGMHSIERNAVIARAADILFAFTVEEPELALGQIAKTVDLPPSTVRRLMTQLIDASLVEQDPATHKYSLSLRLARLGRVALSRLDLVQHASPVMQRLADEVGEAVFLGQLQKEGVVYLAVAHPPTAVRIAADAGDIRPAHTTSLGKVLLASLDEARLNAWLLTHALDSGTSRAHHDELTVRADLEQVRANGLAVNDREVSAEFVSVAAPVRNHLGATVAALAISAPAYRVAPERLRELADQVRTGAAQLTERLGGSSATA